MAEFFGYLLSDATRDRGAAAADHAGKAAAKQEATSHTANTLCIAPHTLETDGICIGLSGEPLFRGNAITPEGWPGVLAAIANRYQSAGAKMLDELEGPFALAILVPAKKRALLAVDRMGVERLTYAARPDVLVFGKRADAVAGFPGIDTALRNQALYDFLFMHMVPAPQTVYEGVYKLPPGSALLYENGQSRKQRYWSPKYNYGDSRDFPALKRDLLDGLSQAVADSGLDTHTGAFLSGGLDSSSVAGTLAGLSEQPARTFTVGFGEADYDELRFARIANGHFGCDAHEYAMKPADIVDAFPRIAAAYDEPFGNSSAAPTYFCAKLAADNGVMHLLAGDGGDELFGGNERYLRHWIFELYLRLPATVRRGLVEPALRGVSPEGRIPPLSKLRSYVDQALIPLPERFESWNFMYREGGSEMLDADFAAAIDKDAPIKQMRKVWEASPSDDLLETMLWYDWHFTLADNDLRKVGTMCELAGVRVSYPMLHPAVVNLSLRVPPNMKIRGTELRTFFKRAMADFLPSEIIKKKKHGFGLPFGLWLKSDKALGEMIFSHLADLKKRHIIDAKFIDNLIAQHRAGHASYFGYAIWDLAMLEAWLAANRTRGR